LCGRMHILSDGVPDPSGKKDLRVKTPAKNADDSHGYNIEQRLLANCFDLCCLSSFVDVDYIGNKLPRGSGVRPLFYQ